MYIYIYLIFLQYLLIYTNFFPLASTQPVGDNTSNSLFHAKLHLHGIPIYSTQFHGIGPSKSPVVISGRPSTIDVTSGVAISASWSVRKFRKKKHQYCRSPTKGPRTRGGHGDIRCLWQMTIELWTLKIDSKEMDFNCDVSVYRCCMECA